MENHNPPGTFGNGSQGAASAGEGALRCGGADPESPLGKNRVALQPLCGARWAHISKEENQKAIYLSAFSKALFKSS